MFSGEFDDQFTVGPQEGNSALFGRDVLAGLVDGIDDFVRLRQPHWRRYRSIGPALLGSAMWINDEALIDEVGELAAACVVVTKQSRKPRDVEKMAPLAALNERTPGMPVSAFSTLTGLAPITNGEPAVIGPAFTNVRRNRADDPHARVPQAARPGREQPTTLARQARRARPPVVARRGRGQRHRRRDRIRRPTTVGVLGELHQFVPAQP